MIKNLFLLISIIISSSLNCFATNLNSGESNISNSGATFALCAIGIIFIVFLVQGLFEQTDIKINKHKYDNEIRQVYIEKVLRKLDQLRLLLNENKDSESLTPYMWGYGEEFPINYQHVFDKKIIYYYKEEQIIAIIENSPQTAHIRILEKEIFDLISSKQHYKNVLEKIDSAISLIQRKY